MSATNQPVRWDSPVFVVAPTFSGATYFTNLLNTHPEIAMTYRANLGMFTRLATKLATLEKGQEWTTGKNRLTGILDQQHFPEMPGILRQCLKDAWRQLYLQHFPHKQFTCYGDRLERPQVLTDLKCLYPDARVIYLVRDGRDRLAAIRSHYRRRVVRFPSLPEPDFGAECVYWNDMTACILRRLTLFRKTLIFRYERFMDDPATEIAAILAFLRLSQHREMCHYIDKTHHRVRKYLGAETAPYASYEHWKKQLRDHEVLKASHDMHDMLEKLKNL